MGSPRLRKFICNGCKKEFKLHCRKEQKYCSKTCFLKNQPIIKGLHNSPKTEFKKGQFKNEKHPFWKGKNAGYRAIHMWVDKNFEKLDTCENCKRSGLKGRQIHWANISGRYYRHRKDWIRLCYYCHRIYDGILPDDYKIPE